MKKSELKQKIDEIKVLSSKYPKTINEALNFNGLAEEDGIEDVPEEEPMDEPEHEEEGGMDVMAFVDDIRKKSLKGMASLAENPDDERYQLLKKIWQICDKKPEQQTAFSNPNNPQQPQQQPMQNQQHLQ
jgi:hypothetical protein